MKQLMLALLRWATRDVLVHSKARIVGVTGSVGKSSFVYLLDAVLKDQFRVKTTYSGNSETGIPLEILGLRKLVGDYTWKNWLKIFLNLPTGYLKNRFGFDYDIVIVEMGIDSSRSPKNMEYLLSMVPVDIGVFLSVALVHSEQFGRELKLMDKEEILRAIANEKGKMVTRLTEDKTAVINGSNKYICELLPKIKAKKIVFGDDKPKIKIENFLLADEQYKFVQAVIETAISLGMNEDDIIKKIEKKFVLPPGRMSIIDGVRGSKIIDSSYNASPAAMEMAINKLKSLKVPGVKYLILGDMRELGEMAEEEHKNLAKLITKDFEGVILVGELMKKYLLPKLKRAKWFGKSLGVGEYLKKKLKNGDWVLVKGSQNTIFLEQAVKEMMARPEEAERLLCRQSSFWEKTRGEFFNRPGNEELKG